MISLGTQQELYQVGRLAQLGILHSKCVCTTNYFIQYEALLVEQQQWLLPVEPLVRTVLSPQDPTYQSRIVTDENILPAYQALDDHWAGIQPARTFP